MTLTRLPLDCFMKEKHIETKLVNEVKKIGGLALKLFSPGYAGLPDRLILVAYGKIAFVEVKAPGKRPRPLQIARHEQLRKLGFKVYTLDNEDDIGGIIDAISTT